MHSHLTELSNTVMNMGVEEVTVIVVPFPAQSHLNQLLQFALHLASRGFLTHFATSASHNRQVRLRLQGIWSSESLEKIHFHDLPIPPFPTPPPNPNSATKFPSHLIPSYHASIDLRPPLASLLRSLSSDCRRLVVVHDPLMTFASHEAHSIGNAESYQFQCVPTFNEVNELPHFLQLHSSKPRQEVLDVILTKFEGDVTNELREFLARHNFKVNDSGTLFNSCRAIEGEFFDLLAGVPRYDGKKLFAVGPLNNGIDPVQRGSTHECLKWLDEQPLDSVVYVSFGSTTTISDDQIEQLAIGLKKSKQRFIWVLRDADRGDIFAVDDDNRSRKLPDGFEKEVECFGIVVRDWAPQLEILAHPSTGAFMSHCGWNSCMESLSLGVPIIAWPMHSDQPRNAVMVTKYLKAGVAVREWGGIDHELVLGVAIEEAIRKVMVFDEGKEIRDRAKALRDEVRLAVSDGGSSKADLDSYIAHITR